MFANIFRYMQLAMFATVVVEGTLTADAGKSKQQKAIDMVNNEAQVSNLAFPGSTLLTAAAVNLAVAGFNLAGLFNHKTVASTGAVTP